MSKDDEIAQVVAQLNGLLDQLQVNVGELTAILDPPPPNGKKETVP
jgi:hypothetical protein